MSGLEPPQPPTQLAGFTVGDRVRARGVLAVHAGTNKLGVPVELHIVEEGALPAEYGVGEFLSTVRDATRARHESLAGYIDGGAEAGVVFAVARAAEGRTVDELLGRGGALANERALSIAASVADALGALEEVGLRHGDLTPRRIALPGRGDVLLKPPRLLPAGLAPRRARYQSPEEARGDRGDVRSDLFVLGLLLVEMLTAKSPVKGSGEQARAHLAGDHLRPVADLLAGRDPQLMRIVSTLLANDPDRRFQTAADAATALVAVAGGEAVDEALMPSDRPETAPFMVLPAAATAPARSPEAARGDRTARRDAKTAPQRKAATRKGGGTAATAAQATGAPGGRKPGRLFLKSRLGESRLEIDEDIHVGWPKSEVDVRASPEAWSGAAIRIERRDDADVLVPLLPGVTVGGEEVAECELHTGDVVEGPNLSGRYERGRRSALRAAAPPEDGTPDSPGMRRLVVGAIAGLTLVVVGFIAVRTKGILLENSGVDSARATAAAELARAKKAAAKSITGPAEGPGPERAAHAAFESARGLARRRPDEPETARKALERVATDHAGTAWGALARLEAMELGRRERTTRSTDLDKIIAEAEADAAEGALVDALRRLRRLADERPGTVDAGILRRAVVRLDGEIQAQIDGAAAAARVALAAQDFRAALEAVDGALEIAPFDRRETLTDLREQIDRAMNPSAGTGGGSTGSVNPPDRNPPERGGDGPAPVRPPNGGESGGTTAGGGDPVDTGPDPAARDKEADTLFKKSRRQMDSGKHAEALGGFTQFLREYADTPTGTKRDLEVRRRITSLAAGEAGIIKLFRGVVEKRERGRWRITYDFEDEEQMLDFRDVKAFQATPRAKWSHVSGGTRAKGSGAFMLDAKFKAEFLSMRVRIDPERAHDIGVMFFEHNVTNRFYLYTLQNSWFKLGKGPGAETFQENAIILFGPDMWRDTPPGEIGFVRKTGSEEPKFTPGEAVELKAGKSEGEVWLRFPGGRTIRGSAYGDVKYEFKGLSPAVFVLNSSGFFDDIVIEGVPDPDWVAERWRAILSEL